MSERLANLALLVVSCLVGCVVCESAYRFYVDWREQARWLEPRQFTVYSDSIWNFDETLGFTYRPAARADVAIIQDGIPRRCRSIVIDEHGSPGRGLNPAKFMEPEFIVLGDSFTAMVHEGATWPDMLADIFQERLGRELPILNLSRDGYGVLQMFDQAAALAHGGSRPRAFIIAIIGPDLIRPRSWRMTLERDGAAEVYMSAVPSLKVVAQTHVRAAFIDPRVTQAWCDKLRASGHSDEIAKDISTSFNALRQADERLFRRRIEFFDLSECYLCNRLRYGRPTKETPANRYSPAHGLMRFQDDARFADDVRTIGSTGVPIWLVYLPYEPELRAASKQFSSQEQSLMKSLESVAERVIDLTPKVPLDDDTARSLTMQPEDYHPSRAGIEYYACELAQRIAPVRCDSESRKEK